jgi:hypothetical protein
MPVGEWSDEDRKRAAKMFLILLETINFMNGFTQDENFEALEGPAAEFYVIVRAQFLNSTNMLLDVREFAEQIGFKTILVKAPISNTVN